MIHGNDSEKCNNHVSGRGLESPVVYSSYSIQNKFVKKMPALCLKRAGMRLEQFRELDGFIEVNTSTMN